MIELSRRALGAALLFACVACAEQADDELIDEEDAVEAIEEEGSLEVPPDESAHGAGLVVEERMGLGSYLADRDSRAVYLFTADGHAEGSACYDECAETWPPVVAEEGTEPVAEGAGVRPELLGTIQRTDGRTQVTYGGHPLYLYSEDAGPGEITGQDMHTHGGEWYLVTPAGDALEDEAGG